MLLYTVGNLLDLLGDVGAALNSLSGPWILGGDFNNTPAALLETGWLGLVNGVVHAPTKSRCNDKTHDFFVVSRNISHAIRKVCTIQDAGCQHHCPAKLDAADH